VKVEDVTPAAARTILSFRDVGYNLPRAVADIIDNSIAANATKVDIRLKFLGNRSWIRIADNGEGMDASSLHEGMRYGSEREYAEDDLGRFGFGLKTASTSQCRRVTVASRKAGRDSDVEIRCLDLKHIEETNRWEVLVIDEGEAADHLLEPIEDKSGTVVLWEQLDRILEYKDPFGHYARMRLLDLADEIHEHLAMVFHRFLNSEIGGRTLSITVNDTPLDPWDPFCRKEGATITLTDADIEIASSSGLGIVNVKPYVLPHQHQFSSQQAWRRASGPSKWNRQQGLYVYRANRLIQSGGWNRIRTIDEHDKLARIAVDFFPDLDAAFSLNIEKASVKLPGDLRDHLKPIIAATIKTANGRYRDKESRKSGKSKTGAKEQKKADTKPCPNHKDDEGKSKDGLGTDPPSGTPVRQALEESANVAGEVEALERIVIALVDKYPEVASELGW